MVTLEMLGQSGEAETWHGRESETWHVSRTMTRNQHFRESGQAAFA